jgi:chemotaxis methyl-accepting protein methylase
MEPEEEQVYDMVRRHLLKTRGFDISGYSRSFIGRAVRKRVGRSQCRSALEYIALLRRDDDEVNELIAALSVNVTDFFRDDGAFEALTDLVIRPLVIHKIELGWSALRIWSAGCATGQETYTIAICVAEQLRKIREGKNLVVRVQGTDLSKSALATAARGAYSDAQLKGVPKDILSRYFSKTASGYETSTELRRMIRFSQGNLLDRPSMKFFDMIVCRNVVIYFSRPMHDKLVRNFYAALRPGGYLMLGRTETLMGDPRRLFDVVDHENRIFRRLGEEGSSPHASETANGAVSDNASRRSS